MTPTPFASDRRLLTFGIVNVTPDSFSDGGSFFEANKAVAQAESLLHDGADVVDVGAESTRPGSKSISDAEEWARLEPVLSAMEAKSLLSRTSVDTRKFSIMQKVSRLGVRWINCVGALPEEDSLKELIQTNSQLGFIVTHMHGSPENMHLDPLGPSKAVSRVEQFFESSKVELKSAGFLDENILFDPGIGFGKTDAANVSLLAHCPAWSKDYELAVGISRKGIFSRLLGVGEVTARDPVSKLAELTLVLSGVRMIRTHDVKGLHHCLRGAGVLH